MIYLTGDTHGRFGRFQPGLYGQPALKAGDTVIICGDFGGLWKGDEHEERQLDRLAALPCTILFADGNHENYDLLDAYPVTEWQGGRVQALRPDLLHLLRGQIYEIEGRSFFVMGGAESHDIRNGILDMDAPDFERRYARMRNAGKFFRVKGLSWWERELPSEEELQEGLRNLRKHGNRVDYIISHCAPSGLQEALMRLLNNYSYPDNALTQYLQTLSETVDFTAWFCGHYHRQLSAGKYHVLSETIIPLPQENESGGRFP